MTRNLEALRVTKAAHAMLESGRIEKLPLWHNIMSTYPPSESMARPLMNPRAYGRRSSRMFKPLRIAYKEDKLRSEFFGDHPWELARPRIVLEDDGKNAAGWDWSKIEQRGKKLDGESVVQRQMWLMENKKMLKNEAYDQARREFYRIRHSEDIERRIAREEALSTGAYFGLSALDIGMQLENKNFENWKVWAQKEIVLVRAARSGLAVGPVSEEEEPAAVEGEAPEGVVEEAGGKATQ